MAGPAPKGNTYEPLLNGTLAQVLRMRGFDAAAEAEQAITDSDGNRHLVDILIDLDEQAVAIEAEFSPAATVEADARKRLPKSPLHWRGLPIESVYAVTYPKEVSAMPESQARAWLLGSISHPLPPPEIPEIQFRQINRGATGRIELGASLDGVNALVDSLHNFWVQHGMPSSIDDIVDTATEAIDSAAGCLARVTPTNDADDLDTPAALALIWLNALLFQELLAANLDATALPPEHSDVRIERPGNGSSKILQQWTQILDINWWPIFAIAKETLEKTPAPHGERALTFLRDAARSIAARGEIRRHDIAGRIYHRLLDSRKFLATNYTTIPAAVLLAALAFDSRHPRWKGVNWQDPSAIRDLHIVDPACGTGTLLMAALQEIFRNHRHAVPVGECAANRDVAKVALEQVLQGYDVVPGAVHLTAATLSMAETSQVIKKIRAFRMPHDVEDGRARLGSLDFLESTAGGGQAQAMPLFPTDSDPHGHTGTGEKEFNVNLPATIDLMIANPPYTRAGGPGDKDNTDWNPIFGSMLSKGDAEIMKRALQRALAATAASSYAGLGSAFLALADERLAPGGRLAFVLPATLATGSRWESLRAMLLENYNLEWVVVSHDDRHRPHRATMPGRRWVGFSESTRIAEVLIVATKRVKGAVASGVTRFVNLRHNMDDPLSAIACARALLGLADTAKTVEVMTGDKLWGELTPVSQKTISEGPWFHTTFVQGRLSQVALDLTRTSRFRFGDANLEIPVGRLNELCKFGPYHMQVKNPNNGLFDIFETDDPTRMGHPALWHHKSTHICSLAVSANARLHERTDRDPDAQKHMLALAGRLQLACELGHAPQRLGAVITDEPMLGVSSWITLLLHDATPGMEEALCLWLNSTPGLLLRIAHANRPYLGRSRLPHEKAYSLPILDIGSLSAETLTMAVTVFEDLRTETLEGFAHLATDPVRREIDARLATDILGAANPTIFEPLAHALNNEPTVTARH